MDLHFRAFSFVDRIHSIEAGDRITGHYSIPAGLENFPIFLAAEAVGQLAAWAAMEVVDFAFRPMAGLARRVALLSPVGPGQMLELAAKIESVDEEAVAYCGTASVEGEPVLKLQDCVGPMLPLSEFDDPQLVRRRFELLQGDGAVPDVFGGVPDLPLDGQDMLSGESMQATLRVPQTAEFFADHFPRKPVLPGTLLSHANLELACGLMENVAPATRGTRWFPREILDVKLRSFIPPGETLELGARVKESSNGTATVALQIRTAGKRIGSCRVNLALENDQ